MPSGVAPLGFTGFTLGFGAAVGFGLGGWLVGLDIEGIGWRAIFFVNVPIGLLLMGAAWRLMPRTVRKPQTRLDLIGASVLLFALLCVLGPLLVGADFHWARWLLAVIGVGLALLTALWPLERWIERRQGLPLVHLDLLRDRSFRTGLATVFCFQLANISFYLLLTLHLQLALRYSPLQSGGTVLPLALGFALMSRFAGPRAQQRGVTALLEGCGVQIAGIALLASALATGLNTAPVLALVLIVFGLGQAMVMAPLYGLVLTKVTTAHAGSGGGVMITVQQVGNGTGVAVIGAVYYAVASAYSALAAVLACLVALTTAIAITAVLLGRLNRLTGDMPGGRCS